MKKRTNTVRTSLLLMAFLFCLVTCERTDIKPEVTDASEIPNVNTNTPPVDRFVGTWVRYNETRKDTLRFSDNGIMTYTLGDYHSDGSLYIDQYFYECTDNYLINYNNNSVRDYSPQLHYVVFNEDNTLLNLGTFNFLPADVGMVYSVLFKKID